MTTATFRWVFRNPSLARRVYAEIELEDVGRVGDGRYYAAVYLVRDEMPRPARGVLIDPDQRTGMRVYVGACHDERACRRLAFLAAVEGTREAYTLIYDVLLEHPEPVRKFGDEWLIEMLDRARGRASASTEIGSASADRGPS